MLKVIDQNYIPLLFYSWVEELSSKEITSGVRRAKELLKSTKKLEVDEKDQRYVNNQLYGLEHRLDNAINKMEFFKISAAASGDIFF